LTHESIEWKSTQTDRVNSIYETDLLSDLGALRAPEDVGSLEGRDIWGSDNIIMLGEQRIARRDGYTGIVFEVDSIASSLRTS
jgi:hypothetical protein